MARYDRIAPLDAPTRDQAFPAWLVLRDIEGHDRDSELARRARLRFLALRPVRRLLDCGFDKVSRDSYFAQIEAAREELGYLPARDAERARLARFLHQVSEHNTAHVIAATIEMADACLAAGQSFGAEEFALTARGLAAVNGEFELEAAACTTLARVYRARADWDAASASAAQAIAIAERTAGASDVVRARAELALLAAARGDAPAAHHILNETLEKARASRDAQAEALAHARYCACELVLGNATAALEHGWPALRQLDDQHDRATLLEHVGTAFASAGLHKAAERCFAMIAQRTFDAGARPRAPAAAAVQAAATGAAETFHERRGALLREAAEWSSDPRISSFVNLELGRGCVIVQDIDCAREHVRDAITVARRHSMTDILHAAETVLSALETNSTRGLLAVRGNGPAADAARRIADQIDAMPDLMLAAT